MYIAVFNLYLNYNKQSGYTKELKSRVDESLIPPGHWVLKLPGLSLVELNRVILSQTSLGV